MVCEKDQIGQRRSSDMASVLLKERAFDVMLCCFQVVVQSPLRETLNRFKMTILFCSYRHREPGGRACAMREAIPHS